MKHFYSYMMYFSHITPIILNLWSTSLRQFFLGALLTNINFWCTFHLKPLWSTSLHNREALLFTNMVHFSPTSNLLEHLSPKTFFLVHFSPDSNLLEHFSPKTFFLVHISPNSNLLDHFSPQAFFLVHLLLDPLDPLHVLSREVWLTRLQNPLFNLLLDA